MLPEVLHQSLQDKEIRHYAAGDFVIRQGEETGCLYFLLAGRVEVLKDDTQVALAAEPGVVFGEMAALLGGAHTASVRAMAPSEFCIVAEPRVFFRECPEACLYICKLLAKRLDTLNSYLVDVKRQFEDHDHIGMVDEVLEALLHRQPRQRIRPDESTARHGEVT